MDRREERARAHAVDADPVAGVLDRRDLRELDHRRLRRAVRRGVRPRGETGDRRGEDDRARLLRAHDGHRGADAVDGAEDVDPERALPVLGRQVVDATVRREHPGVADQHVEAAEALDRQGDDGFDLRDVAHVGQHRLDRAAMLRQAVRRSRRATASLTSLSTTSVSGSPAKLLRQRGAERPARAGDRDRRVGRVAHTSRYPPSTLSTVPVTNADASDARNWYAPARSVGCAPAPLRGVPEHAGRELGVVLPPLGQRRVEPARRDDVHGDARGREVEREPLRQADEAGLRRAVRGEPFARPLAEHRAGEDQPPAVAHHPGRGAGAEERAGEVHVEDLAPDRRIGLARSGHDRRDPRVADPHVDAAPFGHGGVGDRFVELLVGHVAAAARATVPGARRRPP